MLLEFVDGHDVTLVVVVGDAAVVGHEESAGHEAVGGIGTGASVEEGFVVVGGNLYGKAGVGTRIGC